MTDLQDHLRLCPSACAEKAGLPSYEKSPCAPFSQSAASFKTVEETLLALMSEGTSDSARVSAAKALMDYIKFMSGDDDKNARQEESARQALVADVKKILASWTAAKLGNRPHPGGPKRAQSQDELAEPSQD